MPGAERTADPLRTAGSDGCRGLSAVEDAAGEVDLEHHVARWFGLHPQVTPAIADELLQRPELYAWIAGDPCVAGGCARPHVYRGRIGTFGSPDFVDGQQDVCARADVGMLGDKLAIDDDRVHVDHQAAAARHALAPERGDVDQHPFNRTGFDVEGQPRRGLRKHDVDVLARDPLQHRFQIPDTVLSSTSSGALVCSSP